MTAVAALTHWGNDIVWECRTVGWEQPPVRQGKDRLTVVALTAAFSWRRNIDSVETGGASDALSSMGWLIGIAVFTLVVGYAVRERKSRLRSRRYYHDD